VIISIQNIVDFSICPRYYSFLKKSVQIPSSKRLELFSHVVKKCYIRRTEYSKKADWRVVMSWVDREVFRNVDITDFEALQSARKLSESILMPLQNWYISEYEGVTSDSFVDVPILYELKGGCIRDSIPVLIMNKVPTLLSCREDDEVGYFLHRDLSTMSRAWLAMELFDLQKIEVRNIFLGTRSSVATRTSVLTYKACQKTKRYVESIAACLFAGIDYPSQCIMCDECQFRQQCSL
jgi:hypothetical protein